MTRWKLHDLQSYKTNDMSIVQIPKDNIELYFLEGKLHFNTDPVPGTKILVYH